MSLLSREGLTFMSGRIFMMILLFLCDLAVRWYRQPMEIEDTMETMEEEESGLNLFWFLQGNKDETKNTYSWENAQKKYVKFHQFLDDIAMTDLGMRFTVGMIMAALFNLILQIVYFYDDLQGFEVDTVIHLYQHNQVVQRRNQMRQRKALMMNSDQCRTNETDLLMLQQNSCGDVPLSLNKDMNENVADSIPDGDPYTRWDKENQRQLSRRNSWRRRSSSKPRSSETSLEDMKAAPHAKYRSRSHSSLDRKLLYAGAEDGEKRSKEDFITHSEEPKNRRTNCFVNMSPQRKRSFSRIPQLARPIM